MNKFAKVVGLSFFALMLVSVPAFAQEKGGEALITFSGAFGAALVTMGAAYGIGKLAAASVESMARQPEVAPRIQTAMLIAAALIEGFTFFAIFVCMQQNPWSK